MEPSRKRSRSAGALSAQQKAIAAQIRFSKAQPWSDWGAQRVQRGSDYSLSTFGPSWKEASEEQRANRARLGYSGRGMYVGRGMYTGRGKYYGKVLGGLAGAKLGGMVGLPRVGALLGGMAGDALTNRIHAGLKGRGEYEKTHSNELMAGSTSSPPVFQSAGDEAGALMVSHREYVGDIFAPAAATVSDFTVQSFPLNPGLEQTFPWLSQIAQNYEEYELKQCVFEFVSTVQDINSSNGQVGTIITATQYNPSQPDFADKPAMAAYAHAVSGKSTDNQTHGVECDPAKLSGAEGKYVRANPVMFGEDLKTYDHGRFQLATHNIPSAMASGTLGELYVQYTVCLRKPKFFTGRGLGLTRYLEVQDASIGASLSNTYPFGTDGQELTARQNNIAVKTEKTANALKLTFPAYYGGRLRIALVSEGSGITWTGTDPRSGETLSGNVTFVNDLFASGSSTADSPNADQSAASSIRTMSVFSINVEPSTNATDNSVTFNFDYTGGTFNQSSIDICEYNTFGSNEAPQLVNAAGTAVTL